MKYQEVNYKYLQVGDDEARTKITGYSCHTDFIDLHPDGRMVFHDKYAWDGCSGPTRDDKTNMVPGRNHDGKYQLMRLGLLPQSCRCIADQELRDECRARGMSRFRAWYYFEGVDHFAAFAAKYGTEPKILTAP